MVEPGTEATLSHVSPPIVALTGHPFWALIPHPWEEEDSPVSKAAQLRCPRICVGSARHMQTTYRYLGPPLPALQGAGVLGDTQAVWATQPDWERGSPFLQRFTKPAGC